MASEDRTVLHAEWVKRVQACKGCPGAISPSESLLRQYPFVNQTEPLPNNLWSMWQGNPNAEVMVVGQDWGGQALLKEGVEEARKRGVPGVAHFDKNTNKHLVELLSSIDIHVEPADRYPQRQVCYFTNAALCLRGEGGMQKEPTNGDISVWLNECRENTRALIEDVVHPKVVIALGEGVFKSILTSFRGPEADVIMRGMRAERKGKSGYARIVESTYPVWLTEPHGSVPGIRLFPVYHCGNLVVNTKTRAIDKQKEDWNKIQQHMRELSGPDPNGCNHI